jgi:DNA primase
VVGFGGRVLGEGEPKYLNSPETPLFQKGQEIYGLGHAREAIREARRALVVEGYMDVLALAQHGVRYAVATLGTATTPVHVTRLLRELREAGAELVFCFDGDAAGRKAAWRALEVCLPLATDTNPIRFLLLPEGEDPDTLVRAHGRQDFERRIAESQNLSAYLLGELRSQSDLASAEGRSRFLVTARDLVQRLAAPVLRLQLMRAVAPLAQLEPEDVERLFSPQDGPRYFSAAPPRTSAPRAPSSAEQGLLRCVLANPGLAGELDETLLDEGLPETELLRELAAGIAAGDRPSGAMLVERFRGGAHEELVFRAQAAALESHLDAESAAHEFRQLQIALRIRDKHREIEALKGQVGGDPALNAELNLRIKELHELKGLRS